MQPLILRADSSLYFIHDKDVSRRYALIGVYSDIEVDNTHMGPRFPCRDS